LEIPQKQLRFIRSCPQTGNKHKTLCNNSYCALRQLSLLCAAMEPIRIYEFSDARDFLRESLAQKQRSNPRFSVRAWARQLGLQHHALLSMTLNKKRSLRTPLACKMRDALELQGNEARYFDMLVAFNGAKTVEEQSFYEKLLKDLSPADRPFSEMTLDIIRTMAEWYHSAILEMTELQDFKSDPRWIATRLGGNVSLLEVSEALERLLRLELLEHKKGTLKKTHLTLKTPNDISNTFIQKFHRQMIEKSQQALAKDPITKREFRGATFVLRHEKIAEAKKLMREFMTRFVHLVGTDNDQKSTEDVYQLNMQLFSLTQSETK